MSSAIRRLDPRWFQIGALGTLLVYGLFFLQFDIDPIDIPIVLGVMLATQYVAGRIVKAPSFEWKSALISAIGMTVLLRGDAAWMALAAFLCIAMKFVVRIRGKHVFNPTNGAMVALLLCGAPVWVSGGQWGSAALWGFVMMCMGILVVHRAARSDVALAFILAYVALIFGRSLYLGEPMTIPFHRLQSGALVMFTFHMISDPKTTPDAKPMRIAFGIAVATLAYFITFGLFRTNGMLWALFLLSPVVPLLDLLRRAPRYVWRGAAAAAGLVAFLAPARADAFCGFYVAKADTKLFNKSSKVVLVRDDDKTVLTMANDYQGSLKEFAVVIPVPTPIKREQIHIGDPKVVDHLDAYTAPRLVEYFDDDPCMRRRYEMEERKKSARPMPAPPASAAADRARSLGVTIEAQYTVGEYDILILSAKESSGLVTWLKEQGYKIPDGAEPVVGSYLKQNMKFFVAKVNLKEHDKLGGGFLRPIQVAYESPKFMLPIRLGTVNANGTQDLFVFSITRTGRVEPVNYRSVRLPSDLNVPAYVKEDFAPFYSSMFAHQVNKHDMRAVFTEYAWDMNWCDPCAADPLSADELRGLGAFWIEPNGGIDAYVTRLHVRYDRAHFPEDLVFQATQDRGNFQGRYILQHAFAGEMRCSEAEEYRRQVQQRQEEEAKTLADLTGWKLQDIRKKMKLDERGGKKWYENIWR